MIHDDGEYLRDPRRCTCPEINVQRLDEIEPRYVRGLDPGCPLHGTAQPATLEAES